MITKLRKILGLQTSEEKIVEYNGICEDIASQNSNLDELVNEYTDHSNLNKAQLNDLSNQIEKGNTNLQKVADRVKKRYNDYFVDYIGKVKIVKGNLDSLNEKKTKLLSDDQFAKAVKEYEIQSAYNQIKLGYKNGQLTRDILEKALISAEDQIEKARKGVYKNTPENRKSGRAGRRYGDYKHNDNTKEYDNTSIESEGHNNSLSQAEEQGSLLGGSRNVEASYLLRRNESTSQTSSGVQRERRLEQVKLLEEYAKKENIWHENLEEFLGKEQFVDSGSENEVYKYNKEGFVAKINNLSIDKAPLDYLDRLSYHNALFPDVAYEVLGFGKDNKGKFSVLVKQPFIISNEETKKSDIDDYLAKLGFKPDGLYCYSNDNYIISDVHEANVLKKEGILYFIDAFVSKNDVSGEIKDKGDIKKAYVGDLLAKRKTKYSDCIIRDSENRILFLKRDPNNDFCPDVYGLPGGHVDLGENFKEASIRECKEETNLDVTEADLVHTYEDDKCIIKYFECKVEQNNPFTDKYDIFLHGNEHSNYSWMNYQQYKDQPLIMNLGSVLEELYGDEISKNEIQKSVELLIKGFKEGLVSEDVLEKAHKYIRKTPDGKGGWNYIYKESKGKVEKKEVEKDTSKGNFNILAENIKDYAKQVIEGKKHLERLSPEEEQGCIRGGKKNVESTILLGTDAESNTGSIDGDSKRQELILEEFSKKEGFWFKDIKFKGFVGRGAEAVVHKYDDNHVVKIMDYSFSHETPLDYLDRLSLHNFIFPAESYELIGVSKIKDEFESTISELRFVVKQQFFEGKSASLEDIKKDMEERGFVDRGGNLFTNENYVVEDLHTGNVLKDKEDNLFYIDPIIRLNIKGEGYDGNRTLGKITIPNEDKIEKSEYTKEQAALIVLQKAFELGQIKQDILEKAVSQYGASKHQQKIKVTRNGKTFERTQNVGGGKEGEQKQKTYTPEELANHAKSASEQDLQRHIKEGGDEKMRKVAHEELDRRGKEESVQEDPKEDEKKNEAGAEEEYQRKKDKLLKDVDVLVKLKKKLFSKVNIESPKSKEEKELEGNINKIFSEINSMVKEHQENKKENKKGDKKKEPTKKTENNKEENKYVEKFRTLSDDQVKFYLDAPYPDVKEAAKVVSDERGLKIISKEEYRKQFRDLSESKPIEVTEFYVEDQDKVKKYLENNEVQSKSLVFYKGLGFHKIRKIITDKQALLKEYEDADEFYKDKVEGIVKKLESDIVNISAFIANNRIDKDITLNRRVNSGGVNGAESFFTKLKEGDIYEDKSFSSTALRSDSFFGDFNITILAKKGSNVANADNFGEQEYIVDKGSKFRVIETQKDGLGITVELL